MEAASKEAGEREEAIGARRGPTHVGTATRPDQKGGGDGREGSCKGRQFVQPAQAKDKWGPWWSRGHFGGRAGAQNAQEILRVHKETAI